MLLPALFLFLLFLLLSAFFSSAETAFIATNPYKIDYLEKSGSKSARLFKKLMGRVDNLLATILIGNTLVNTAAASVATFVFVSFIPDKKQAVILATVVTTVSILLISEISPKTYAAHNPIKLSLLFVRPIKFFVHLFYPLVKAFTLLNRLIFPSSRKKMLGLSKTFNEEEVRVLFAMGIKGMSSLRRKMIFGVLDIGSRPVREIMIPRPQVKAIEIGASLDQILQLVRSAGFSRFPVYKGRLDNIEGVIHAKDVILYLVENKTFRLNKVLRRPFFIPEFAPIEKVLIQMQKTANHLMFVVDEFGNMEGIVTLEDIIEEIIGEIQDEYDPKAEESIIRVDKNLFIIKGNASIKDIIQEISLPIPLKEEYMTLAGFFLNEFGKIPQEGDVLEFDGYEFVVEKMDKRHISLIRVKKKKDESRERDEDNS